MEISRLKKLSISHLILIILNDKNSDILRKCAEVELRKRIKHLGWCYDDLLHFDDKVIQQRGYDVDNYLISQNVSLQQLMETYLTYCHDKCFEENSLLFSEKNLCNENDLGSPFFTRVCNREIKNLDRRIGNGTQGQDNRDLVIVRNLLQERKDKIRQDRIDLLKNNPYEALCYNDALYQIDDEIIFDLYMNLSEEERYRYLSSPIGVAKLSIADILNDTILDPDEVQYLYGLHFIRKDSAKLKQQKRQIMSQVMKRSYDVDYSTDAMRKVLSTK